MNWTALAATIVVRIAIDLAIPVAAALGVLLFSRAIKANRTRIRTANGVQESTYVKIGGIRQYLQIRGKDVDNPVIVFLHGGPGSPMAYVSYYYQPELESDYTFVNWDQRGCGRTYYANPDAAGTLSLDALLNDLDQLVDYLAARFHQEKIIIMGHSWGTILGSLYASQHPEKVSAYIGVSQNVCFSEAAVVAAKSAAERASARGNSNDASRILAALDKSVKAADFAHMSARDYLSLTGLTQKYLAGGGAMSPLYTMWLGLSSPDFSLTDLRWFLTSMNMDKYFRLERPLLEEVFFGVDLRERRTDYEVPIHFISGDRDWRTPHAMVQQYCEMVESPAKQVILIKGSGHSPFMEDRDAFAGAVRRALGNS